MRTSAQVMVSVLAAERSWPAVLADLFKARLTFLVLLTTLVGFYAGSDRPVSLWLLAHTLMGTALLACGAAALNQYLERDYDARMQRTQGRPLPAGQLAPETARLLGTVCALAGLLYLSVGVNLLTGSLGAGTLASYLFLYTPLKRVSWLNTLVGAVPGALPPLMGWTAAQGRWSLEGGWLFAVQLFWQVPHFLAIAWLYREDYARGGFVMLPNVDPAGTRTSRVVLASTAGLLAASVGPVVWGQSGWLYLAGAAALGLAFGGFAVQFARTRQPAQARRLFLASILYLPLLLGLLVADRLRF
jgi:heme o synthase